MGLVISMRPVLPELDRRLPSQGHQDRKSILVVHISWSWELKEHMLLQKQMFYAPTDLLNYVRKFLFLFWLCCAASGIFVSWPGIEPWVTAVKSPNHWTARALPTKLFYGNMCGNELDLKKTSYLSGCIRSWLWHVGCSSLTRDQTQALCTGSAVLATGPPGKSH